MRFNNNVAIFSDTSILKHLTRQAIYFFITSIMFLGQWKKDKRHGEGVYKYPNDDIYEGSWREDNRDGLGTYVYKEIGIKFVGIWINGKMQGSGQVKYPKYTFYGTFKDNMVKFVLEELIN